MINFNKNFEKYLSDTPTDLKTVFININFDKGYFTIYDLATVIRTQNI